MAIFNNDGRGGLPLGRLAIVAVMAIGALISYFSKFERNPMTGKLQPVAMSPQQEVAMGLQAAPQMASEMGGEADDARAVKVREIGQRLITTGKNRESEYGPNFKFHLLADKQTVNAFALPGGQIFITAALYDRLANEAQLAGVLGHEVGHVIYRHSSEQMAKSQLGQSLVGAVAIGSGDQSATYAAQAANQMINLKYGRTDELQADEWGLISMEASGFDPAQMLAVMQTLKAVSGGGNGPAIFSTHPDPDARIVRIRAYLDQHFPHGVPENLTGGAALR